MNYSVEPSFDSAAATYDDEFTLSQIGKLQRSRVYYWLEKSGVLANSKSIFEVNCGTGFDAEYFHKLGKKVVSTDASREMIQVCKQSRSSGIDFYERKFSEISIDDNVEKSDLVFSNFGGLNCLSEDELRLFFKELSKKQNSGDKLALVVMPENCVVEDFYLLLKGQFSEIGRRSRKTHLDVDVNGEKIRTFYHSPWTVKQLLFNYYKVELVRPIAHFLPPSYLEPFFKKKLWALRYLSFMERTFGKFSFLASNADHFILIAQRK